LILQYSAEAVKELKKLDRIIQQQIKKYMTEICGLEDPRIRGKGLKGNLATFWRYRGGDYRIICDIQEDKMIILILRIGHRKEVYDK
jgi:mRNA interferase RelE/StbE